jgi:hypothetical protein
VALDHPAAAGLRLRRSADQTAGRTDAWERKWGMNAFTNDPESLIHDMYMGSPRGFALFCVVTGEQTHRAA